MQLHSFLRLVVISLIPDGGNALDPVDAPDHHLLVEGIKIHHALDEEGAAVLKRRAERGLLLLVEPQLHAHGVRVVRDRYGEYASPASRLPALRGEDLPAHRHLVRLFADRGDRLRLVVEAAAVDQRRIVRQRCVAAVLLLFLLRQLFFAALRGPFLFISLGHEAHLLADLPVLLREEIPVLLLEELRRHFRGGKAGPLAKNLLEVFRKVLLPLLRDDTVREADVNRAVPGEFEGGMQQRMLKKRADFLQFPQHAVFVNFVEILRRKGGGQAEPLHDLHVHLRIREDLFPDGGLYLKDRRFLDPVFRQDVHAQAVPPAVDRDALDRRVLHEVAHFVLQFKIRKCLKKWLRLLIHAHSPYPVFPS